MTAGSEIHEYAASILSVDFAGARSTRPGCAVSGGSGLHAGRLRRVEMLKFEGMEIRIDYAGKIASADEIRFTRRVGDFATEELVARRQK